ncbi:MAG: galactitol-1-phosphate 5-dehydrogenase [Chloroflexia bacterium]|nr:galactitol-1-phosphate 5-dehydrogenase [Chloroflexia bacterium]
MRSAVWHGPKDIQVSETVVPGLAPGEVLLKVEAVGICGSELSGYLGHNSLRVPPLVMGHEFSATVVERAPDVTSIALGSRVTVNPMVPDLDCVMCRAGLENLCLGRTLIGAHRPGAFAEFVAVPALACYQLPDSVDTIAGTLVEPTACALRAVELAHISPGSSVLILGAGPIGLLSLLVAKAAGANQIIISDLAPKRLELASTWGATHTVNPSKTDIASFTRDITGGLGCDAVIDAVGLPATRKSAVYAVRPGGRVVLIGLHEDDSTLPGNHIIRSEIEIKGAFCYTQANFASSIRLIASGFLPDSSSWVDVRSLEETNDSFAQLIEDPSSAVKIVLQP